MSRHRFAVAAMLILPGIAAGQVFTITPAHPVIGDAVKVTYDGAAPGAALGGKSPIRGEALIMLDSEPPVLVEIAMTQSERKWTGSFPLKDGRARLLLVRVLAGKDQDNGDGNVPCVMIYGSDGKPLAGANLQMATLLSGGGFMEFKRSKDYEGAYAAFASEKTLYPDNWRAYPAEWNAMMRENRGEETRAKIKSALEGFYARFKGNEEAVAAVLGWFDQTGQKERGETIRAAAIKDSPSGPVAEATRRSALFAERDMAKRAGLIEKFLEDFPQKGMAKDQMLTLEFNALMGSKQPEKALALLATFPVPKADLYNAVAWGWIENGENLDKAVQTAKRGVELAQNPPADARPGYFSDEMWKEQNEYSRAMVLDTYGFGLYKQGKYEEAETALRQAYDVSKGDQPEIAERLLMVYNQNGKYAPAMEVGKAAVERSKTTDTLIEYYRTAYTKAKGSSTGFDAILGEARAAGAKDAKGKSLRGRLNKPAIQFSLKDLGGKTVRLADLKGNVVVVDFWATWCGPCKASFPTLQKIYDRYRSNPRVTILALNTWENVSGKEREDLVRKFMADNRYTFPVLYDEAFVEKYGVEGIPTKFVIDKKGDFAFKSIGFSGADEMFVELTSQIDTLLAE